jgi:hypothetical protein
MSELLPSIDKFINAFQKINKELLNTPVKKLDRVASILHEQGYPLSVEKVKNIKNILCNRICLAGKVPGVKTNKNIKVSVDDCPNTSYPERYTRTTDYDAYCSIKTGKCPLFVNTLGSYISCKGLGMKKIGEFLKEIKEVDEELLNQIKCIAPTDNVITSLLHQMESRQGKLFYAKIIDDRIRFILENYPHSIRRGVYDYETYIIPSGDIVLRTSGVLISANQNLLESLNTNQYVS